MKENSLLWESVESRNKDEIKRLIKCGVKPNEVGLNKWTVAHLCAKKGLPECLPLLIGVDVNAPDVLGVTPLMMAASQGHVDVCRILIEMGADADVAADYGYTALMHAVIFAESGELIQLIASASNDETVLAKSDKGTVMDLANENYPETMAILSAIYQSRQDKYLLTQCIVDPCVISEGNGRL